MKPLKIRVTNVIKRLGVENVTVDEDDGFVVLTGVCQADQAMVTAGVKAIMGIKSVKFNKYDEDQA